MQGLEKASWHPVKAGPLPVVTCLQKPRTAHWASSRIRVTLGVSYSFFFFFSSIMLTLDSALDGSHRADRLHVPNKLEQIPFGLSFADIVFCRDGPADSL